MKNVLFALLLLVFCRFGLFAQDATFEFQGYAVGTGVAGLGNFPRAMMPEIIRLDTEYVMYFGYEEPGRNFIMYATSGDMLNWQIGDTILMGSSDTTDREYIMGGPRVIALPSGQYRMFYRASQKYSSSPYYHIRSAISTDGKHFTREGICIEIKNYDSNSFFRHVGHSEFYYDMGNNLRALLTARDSTVLTNQPDNIFMAQSFDGGLTWGNFSQLYASCHDPVVVKDSANGYHAYFTYLNTGFRTANSTNGAGWPATPNTLYMLQAGDTITESSSPIKIADLGAGVDANGKIVLFSNHATAIGPWTNVAYWYDQNATAIEPIQASKDIQILPNPMRESAEIRAERPFQDARLIMLNGLGKQVLQIQHANGNAIQIPRGDMSPGLYFLQVFEGSELLGRSKVLVVD